jgi:excisionase family DNA binding protein
MLKDKYLSVIEASKVSGYTPSHLRFLIRKGKLKAQKVGYAWLVSQKDLASVKKSKKD